MKSEQSAPVPQPARRSTYVPTSRRDGCPARLFPLGLAGGCLVGLAGPLAGQGTLFDLSGTQAGDRYGQALAEVGDVDGDLVPDFLVGTLAGFGGPGYAQVVSGSTGTALLTLSAGAPSAGYGSAVAGAGDLDGDGSRELLVGAPNQAIGGANQAGRVYVHQGATGAVLFTLDGLAQGDHFGSALAGLGDVDGDQVPDFAVAAPDASTTAARTGSVRVVSGASGLALYTLEGTRTDQRFGHALASLPDLDGDGRAELAIGAPFKLFLGSTEPGEVFVHSGAGGALVHAFSGFQGGDSFGRAVAHAGDANGDGVADLAVGAPQPSGPNRGYARVYSGLDAGLLLDWGGDSFGDLFGSAVASLGDLNGDGVSELAVGAPGDDDGGSLAGSVRVFDGLSALTIYTVHGGAANHEFGAALTCLGDVNGDQRGEVAAASPGSLSGVGDVRAMSGVALRLGGGTHVFSVSGAAPSVQLDLDFGTQHAGRSFLVLGAISGIQPGTPYASLVLPLNGDRYFKKTLKLKAFGTLTPPQGALDGNGRAAVAFTPPGSAPATWLVGQTFHHAAVVVDTAGNTLEASNAWPVTIVP